MRDLQATGRGPLSEDPPAPDAPTSADRRRTWPLLAATAFVVLLLDQVTKTLVVANLEGEPGVELLGGLVTLRHTVNTGAAFSLLPQATIVFTAIAVLISVVIIRVAGRLRSRAWAVSLGLVLGGALGNLADRLFRPPNPGRGGVVDWIDVGAWPVFNLADAAVVSGALLAAVLIIRGVSLEGVREGATQPNGAGPANPASDANDASDA